MKNAARLVGIGAAALALGLAGVIGGCDQSPASIDCSTELDQLSFSVKAGAVQPDGSVTIYGAIQFGNADAGAELTVRAVYVAGQPVALGPNQFNFRSWSISLPKDVLIAYAGDAGRAAIPVVAYTYGGCVAHLPDAEEPVVPIPASDAGVEGGLEGGADGAADGGGSDGMAPADGRAPVDAADAGGD